MKQSKVAEAIEYAFRANRPLFLWSSPGGGKSSVARQTSNKMNKKLYLINAQTLEPTDLRGIPKEVNGKTVYVPPDFLPDEDEKDTVLFFDDIPNAIPIVQSACYEIVLERRSGNKKLPPDCCIIAAGNREQDKTGVHRMPSALSNRFMHIDFEIDTEDFINYAILADFHIAVVAFIRFRPDLLSNFDPIKNFKIFASPRTWEYVSDVLKTNPPMDILFELVKGTVGEAVALEFIAFMDMFMKLPDPRQVLADPDNAEVPKEASVKFALCGSLAKMITGKAGKNPKNVDNFFRYAERLPSEFGNMMVSDAVRRDSLIAKTTQHVMWKAKHASDLI